MTLIFNQSDHCTAFASFRVLRAQFNYTVNLEVIVGTEDRSVALQPLRSDNVVFYQKAMESFLEARLLLESPSRCLDRVKLDSLAFR